MTNMDIDRNSELAGKVALVTGSARNIGRSIALELARGGASVIVNARSDREAAEGVAKEVTDMGGKAIVCIADITDGEAVQGMVDAGVTAFGGIDILINNAAIRTKVAFTDMVFDDWVKVRNVGTDGMLRVTMACTPHIIARGGGAIIGIGGLNAMLGSKGGVHKSAVKDAMAGMIRSLSVELGPHNITANVAIVGSFDTDRASGSGENTSPAKKPDVPLGRNGVPQDLSNLIRFLVGPFGNYISGQTIHVNGGSFRPHSG